MEKISPFTYFCLTLSYSTEPCSKKSRSSEVQGQGYFILRPALNEEIRAKKTAHFRQLLLVTELDVSGTQCMLRPHQG